MLEHNSCSPHRLIKTFDIQAGVNDQEGEEQAEELGSRIEFSFKVEEVYLPEGTPYSDRICRMSSYFMLLHLH